MSNKFKRQMAGTSGLTRRMLAGVAVAAGLGAFVPLAHASVEHPKIGFSIDDLRIERWAHDRDYFIAAAKKLGATVSVQSADASADRQNAHSTAISARAVVELFRAVKREKELHREILAFSISHDHATVRIYGYYAEMDGAETKY